MSSRRTAQPDDSIVVPMDWYCGICKEKWRSYTSQGEIRSMPSYFTIKGTRIETRRPDGSMWRAHEDCARQAVEYMESKNESKKKIILSP